MTKGLDGNIYVLTGSGLQRFSQTLTGSATVVAGTIPSAGYGITTLPDGRIAYTAGINDSEVWIYDPSTNTNTASPIYTTPGNLLIDDIEASATGEIALALQMAPAVTIISSTGAFIASATGLAHNPDGLAFGGSTTPTSVYSNNNDGTITRYQLGPGYFGRARDNRHSPADPRERQGVWRPGGRRSGLRVLRQPVRQLWLERSALGALARTGTMARPPTKRPSSESPPSTDYPGRRYCGFG